MSEYTLKNQLQPSRLEYAKNQIISKGYDVSVIDDNKIEFEFNGNKITHFAYTGWHTGKGIKDGRGINNLLKQI